MASYVASQIERIPQSPQVSEASLASTGEITPLFLMYTSEETATKQCRGVGNPARRFLCALFTSRDVNTLSDPEGARLDLGGC